MKDYLEFNDEDLAAFIKRHKGSIHTREFPTRCGTCRFIARFEAAENILKYSNKEHYASCTFGLDSPDGDYCTCQRKERRITFDIWKRIAGK